MSTSVRLPRCLISWREEGQPRRREIAGKLALGSSPDADLVVADIAASRIHAELEVTDRGLVLRDLGSKNGTFVDRVSVQSAYVLPGHVIRIGTTEFTVELSDDTPRSVPLWPEPSFGPLVGASVSMRAMFATLHQVAQASTPVFIHGETGTGKELVARAIHTASPRAAGPYVVVDCAALPENLLESELFGHTRGAFTGAISTRIGAIETATGGTVFLDEIGELPLAMQPKLLRVLEQRTVRRIGETEHRHADVRFLAASHKNLLESVSRGTFREDLYFRLSVLLVEVPPLRDRREDIGVLARHFLGTDADRILSDDVILNLERRPWRGNVRELRNVLDRARALGVETALAYGRRAEDRWGDEATGEIRRPVLGATAIGASSFIPDAVFDLAYKEFREQFADLGEREYLRRRLARADRNISRLAREAELARTYTHKLIKKHGL